VRFDYGKGSGTCSGVGEGDFEASVSCVGVVEEESWVGVED